MKNLVLLLTSGHTVRIAIDDDTEVVYYEKFGSLERPRLDWDNLDLPNVVRAIQPESVVFAYVERTDLTYGDPEAAMYSRISVTG